MYLTVEALVFIVLLVLFCAWRCWEIKKRLAEEILRHNRTKGRLKKEKEAHAKTQAKYESPEAQAERARTLYLATHDPLTGLANRTLFQEKQSASLGLGRQTALMYIDLDHFKKINDSLGHEAGDQLLRAVAGRLRSKIRSQDTCARLGGDEFAIVLPGCTSARAAEIAQEILRGFGGCFSIDGSPVTVKASIGIACAPLHGESSEQLRKNADLALYAAKKAGRDAFAMFNPEMLNKV